MPTDPSDPSSPRSSTRPYQTNADEPKGGSGGAVFFVILLLLLLGGGAAYYFLVYKPAASAGATVLAPPTAAGTPKPATPTPPKPAAPIDQPYGNAERARYVKQADDAFVALREAKSGAFTMAFNAFIAAGSFKGAGLTSRDAIAARRDLLAKSQAANDDYEAFVKTQAETFKTELQKTALHREDLDEVLSGADSRLQTEKNLQLRALQRDVIKAGDAMLAYLDKSYGNWSLNAAQNVVFKKPADANSFIALGKAYNEKLASMNKLQGEITAIADPAGGVTSSPADSPAPATSPTASPTASPVASPTAGAKP